MVAVALTAVDLALVGLACWLDDRAHAGEHRRRMAEFNKELSQ